ncbi:MAG TPA: hypothetical protein P5528_09570 [Steroidobacteraceae bacterium]|nr:hypothetical protein [Steroidobacteraceae bacterium]HRX89681.1 hypothetical protein [Steroidobacteraceae bacterium]
MRRQVLVALVTLAFALPLLAAVPLVDPQPIAVPSGLTAKDVSRGIRMGLTQRGWIVNKENPQDMEATLNVRKHTLRIRVDYDTSTIALKYLDSTNLDYGLAKDGSTRVIHKKYGAWMQNTVNDISRALQLVAIENQK